MCDPPAEVDGFPLVKLKSIMYNEGLDYYGNAVAGETGSAILFLQKRGGKTHTKIHKTTNRGMLCGMGGGERGWGWAHAFGPGPTAWFFLG